MRIMCLCHWICALCRLSSEIYSLVESDLNLYRVPGGIQPSSNHSCEEQPEKTAVKQRAQPHLNLSARTSRCLRWFMTKSICSLKHFQHFCSASFNIVNLFSALSHCVMFWKHGQSLVYGAVKTYPPNIETCSCPSTWLAKHLMWLSVPELSEGTEVSKMAIREGIVFWGVWGGFPPIIGRTGPRA